MGILGEIWKGVQHSYEVNKAFLQEAPIEAIPGVGPSLLEFSRRSSYQGKWAEIKVKGLLDVFQISRCRAVEIGTLRSQGIDILEYTDEGFWVKAEDLGNALAILRGTGLNVE